MDPSYCQKKPNKKITVKGVGFPFMNSKNGQMNPVLNGETCS